MFYVLALVVGAVVGYAFRGYISREKDAAGKAVAAEASKVTAKL